MYVPEVVAGNWHGLTQALPAVLCMGPQTGQDSSPRVSCCQVKLYWQVVWPLWSQEWLWYERSGRAVVVVDRLQWRIAGQENCRLALGT